MRKCRQVFWDALLSLGLSWGIAHYLNPVDLEAKLFVAVGLGLLCLLIILPKALHNLPKDKPWQAALSLPLMLSPLIILFSRPDLYFSPWATVWPVKAQLLIPWSLNGLLNSFIFIIAGYLIAKSSAGQDRITWPKSFLYTTTIILVYTGFFYLGSWLSLPS